MTIRPIRTEEDYEVALDTIDNLFGATPGTPEFDELEVLSVLVERYEDQHYPIDYPTPVDAILFRLEQLGRDRVELDAILGGRSRTSEILNRKRSLSLSQIRKLNEHLGIPLVLLTKEYELATNTSSNARRSSGENAPTPRKQRAIRSRKAAARSTRRTPKRPKTRPRSKK